MSTDVDDIQIKSGQHCGQRSHCPVLPMLTDTKCRNAKSREVAYKLADKNGLFLEVRPAGTKFWRYRFRIDGREKKFTLGEYPSMGLEQARRAHFDARELAKRGINPTEDRKVQAAEVKAKVENTFQAVADAWQQDNANKWTPYYSNQVRTGLSGDLYPDLGNMPIKEVSAANLLKVVKSVERRAPSVAILLRQWSGAVFRYAIAHGMTENDPSAALRGQISKPRVRHNLHLTEKDLPVDTGVKLISSSG